MLFNGFRMILLQSKRSESPSKYFLKYLIDCIAITTYFPLHTIQSKYSLSYLPYYRKFFDQNRVRLPSGKSVYIILTQMFHQYIIKMIVVLIVFVYIIIFILFLNLIFFEVITIGVRSYQQRL